MKKQAFWLPVLGLMALSIISCHKGSDPEPTPNQQELLTGGTYTNWKLISKTVNGTPVQLAACEADNFDTFNRNGDWETNPGVLFCNPNDQIGHGTWSISDNILTLKTSAGNTIKDNIVLLDASNLKLENTNEKSVLVYVKQ